MKKHSIKILFSFLVINFYMGIISFVKVSSPKIQQSDWGEWINDDCFKGIDYRVKKGDYNSYAGKWHWFVQFRNRYNNRISYNYSISEPGIKTEPDHRDHISSGSLSNSKIALIQDPNRCHVRVGYIRFGDDDSGSYVQCDQ